MEENVQKIILEILENSGKPFKDLNIITSSRLREDLGMDSFNLAVLTVHIEEEFNIDIFEKGIVNTVGEIYEMLNLKSS